MVGPWDQCLNNMKKFEQFILRDTKCKVKVELMMSMQLVNNP